MRIRVGRVYVHPIFSHRPQNTTASFMRGKVECYFDAIHTFPLRDLAWFHPHFTNNFQRVSPLLMNHPPFDATNLDDAPPPLVITDTTLQTRLEHTRCHQLKSIQLTYSEERPLDTPVAERGAFRSPILSPTCSLRAARLPPRSRHDYMTSVQATCKVTSTCYFKTWQTPLPAGRNVGSLVVSLSTSQDAYDVCVCVGGRMYAKPFEPGELHRGKQDNSAYAN